MGGSEMNGSEMGANFDGSAAPLSLDLRERRESVPAMGGYFDNAAATMLHPDLPGINHIFANPSSLHELGLN
jgi:hypothetical protein